MIMPAKKFLQPTNRFWYESPDPVTGGTWRISSHRELTSEEIRKQLRTIAFWGEDRPKAGEVSTFKWSKVS